MRISFKLQDATKTAPYILLIFQALFFGHNAKIGEKDHLWTGTDQTLQPPAFTGMMPAIL
jgi:hypothetical protein